MKVASFVAVNEPQQAGPSEQETQEAREARLISLYEGALRSVQRGEAAEAKVRLGCLPLCTQGGAARACVLLAFLGMS